MRGATLAALMPLCLLGLSGVARAERVAPDTFPLGASAQSGAVCEAVRDDDDPGAQVRGARAWAVRCRGWDATLGHLYAYGWRGRAAVQPAGAWVRSLQARARCAAPGGAGGLKVEGVGELQLRACKTLQSEVAYLGLSGVRGGRGAAAEGFSGLADVLVSGLEVVAGAAPPPAATQTLAASARPVDTGGLAQAAEVAEASPETLRERGYSRNLAWRFADAEQDFSALAQNAAASNDIRADAYLNWAVNTSNLGRYDRADALFARAEALVGSDRKLQAEALSYRALDLRNRRQFQQAVEAARHARQLFLSLRPAADARTDTPALTRESGGALVIGPRLASALHAPSAFALATLDPGARLRVQVAQTYLTEATCQVALGDPAAARENLEHARALLAEPGMTRIAGWLRAQVTADLARQDQRDGRKAEAVTRLRLATQALRTQAAGSPAEAYLMVELARAEALAGDETGALRDFEQGLATFKLSRGSLGESADSAETYLDLLLKRRGEDPAHAAAYDARFFQAAEGLGSEATADTVARLSARLSQTNAAAAGLIRALEDTRRQVRLEEASIAELQAQNAYGPAVQAAHQARLKTLSGQAQVLEQKVAQSDPRYGQLVSTEVSLPQLQAKLRPGEMFMKVVLLDRAAYGLAIGPDWVTPYRIGLARTDAEEAVAHLRKPFETQGRLPAYDVRASYAFFQALFGPVKARALAARHIIYEPDPAILSLPIAALATDQASVDLIAGRRAAIRKRGEGVLAYDGVKWLGGAADTSLVVSAASFVQARAQPASNAAQPFLGFGDSVQASASDPRAFASVVERGGGAAGGDGVDEEVCRATRTALLDLKPLKEAGGEIRAVGASLGAGAGDAVTGEAFNDAAVVARTDLDQFRVIYFATHGLLPRPGGCLPEPSLLTSVDDRAVGSDGLLTASKILGMKLDADLVVLSACDTGGGVTSTLDRSGLGGAGEALGGLTRAFIYAGARTLVVSQWQIDSSATVRLMTAMFRSGAPSVGEALRRSMQALIASPDQYSHPYYWAAFSVVGDAARPMPAPSKVS